jgi:hypothetical protein
MGATVVIQTLTSAAFGLLLATGIAAQEDEQRRFSFDGFGTVGLVHSSEDQADFVANPVRPDGAGHTREWSAELDSRLGAQLTASLTPKLSAVVQVIVEQRYDDNYQPTIEWANIKYAFTPDVGVRIGRTALPTFLVSNHRKVGYANPWVRPPVELYGLVPFFNSDGLDASYRHRFGGWTNTTDVTLGRSDVRLPDDGGTAEIRQLVGLFDTVERGSLLLRAAVATSRVSIPSSTPFFDAFRSFGPEGVAIADRFDIDDKRVRFVAVGASYDPGSWFLTAELGRIRSRSLISDRTGGYLTGGYRFGSFTFYSTLSEVRADSETSSPGLPLLGLPPELRGPAAALNSALNEQLASVVAQGTISIGARWDYRPNAVLKLQIDRIDVASGSYGSFVNRQPGFARGSDVTLVSVSTGFVF